MDASPSHASSTNVDNFPAGEEYSVPFLLQGRPTPLNRIILAVIGRIVDQVNFQTRPVGKLNHSLEKLSPSARVLGAIVKINHQTFYLAKLTADRLPPDS